MKKSFLFILILLCTITLVGCGSSGTKKKKAKKDDYVYSYDETDLFDQYGEIKKISELPADEFEKWIGGDNYSKSELKELDKDLSYREIKWQDNGLHPFLMIINDSEKSYYITTFIYYKLDDGTWSNDSNVANVHVAPHSSSLLSNNQYTNTIDYKIDSIVITTDEEGYLGNNEFEFDRVEKNFEGSFQSINVYFTFKGKGNNSTELKLFCVKDGKLEGRHKSAYIKVDRGDGYGDYKAKMKNGQKTIARVDYSDYISHCDSFVYFIEGYYDEN